VYKVFEPFGGKLSTPFRGQLCKVGDTINAKHSWLECIFKNEIGAEGVHAYRDKESAEKFIDDYRHFFRKLNVHLCEIPPFTPYWFGKFGDIAASKMIIKKK
jgi:hypothetical protein